MVFSEVVDLVKSNIAIFRSIALVIILIFIFNFVVRRIKICLLKKSKSKKQVSNIKIFARILSIIFLIVICFIAFFSYIGSWTGLGLVVGLITAGLGFALQKPITGVAAWIMVVIKRPFNIGDRIVIGDVKGEVYDISLTHIYIDEIGRTVDSDMPSGRNIMIPNHLLFEHNIINYTLINDYILGEVVVDVTYESNLEKAMKIANESAIKFVKDYCEDIKREPKVRVKMNDSSMAVRVLFYAPVKNMFEISSNITKEIFDRISKQKDVEIAYPHTEVIFKNKNLFKKK